MANEVEIIVRGRDETSGAFRQAAQRAGPAGKRVGEEFGEGARKGAQDGARRSGDGVLSTFKKIGPLIATAAAAAGLAAGAALMNGVSEALEREKAGDRLAAQLGVGEERSAELGRIAGSLYANAYGESLGEVNAAIRGVLQSGAVMEDESNEQIESITAKVLDLADAFEQDLGKATTAVGHMVRTGLAKNADEALDILTRGFQEGANSADDLFDVFEEYSTKFRDMGISGAQAVGLMSQGLRGGARDADIVADAIKEFSIRAVDGSKLTVEGFKTLGLNAERMTQVFAKGGPAAAKGLDEVLDRLRAMKDPVERNATAIALFGTQAEDLGDALFKLDPSEAVAALGKVEGAAARMGETLADNNATKIEAFRRQALEKLSDFGAQAIGIFERIVRHPQVQAFVEFIREKVLPALRAFAEFISEKVGPIVARLVEDWIGRAVEAFHDLQKIIADNQDELRTLGEWLGKIADFIMEKVVPVVGPALTGSLAMTIRFIGMFIDIISLAVRNVQRFADVAIDTKNSIVKTWDSMVAFVRGLPGRISSAASGMWDGIRQAFRGSLNWIIDRWNSLSFKVPGFEFLGQKIGGFTLGVPNIQRFAQGGITSGGLIEVGERGRELLEVPAGSRVRTADETNRMMTAASGAVWQLIVTLDPSITGPTRDLAAALIKLLRFEARPYSGDVNALIRARAA